MNLFHPAKLLCLTTLLTTGLVSHAAATLVNFDVLFDYSRTSGDRQHNFGQHNPAGGYDDNTSAANFQVTSSGNVFRSVTTTTAWSTLDDEQPDTSNPTMPTDGMGLVAANDVTVRARITDLSSGDGGVLGMGAFLFGLNGNGSGTADGFIAGVTRNPGADTGQLRLDTFTDGARAVNLALGGSFAYGAGGTDYFLELLLTPAAGGGGVDYEINLFADGAISGSGQDSSRLLSSDFDTAPKVSSLTGTLSGYTNGWLGVYFEDFGGGGNNGGVNFDNFYALSIIPEPSTFMLLIGGGLVLGWARRRRGAQ